MQRVESDDRVREQLRERERETETDQHTETDTRNAGSHVKPQSPPQWTGHTSSYFTNWGLSIQVHESKGPVSFKPPPLHGQKRDGLLQDSSASPLLP